MSPFTLSSFDFEGFPRYHVCLPCENALRRTILIFSKRVASQTNDERSLTQHMKPKRILFRIKYLERMWFILDYERLSFLSEIKYSVLAFFSYFQYLRRRRLS